MCAKRRDTSFVWTLETTEPSPWIWPALSSQMFGHQLVYPTPPSSQNWKPKKNPGLQWVISITIKLDLKKEAT
jgi:hypothetical protein